MKHIKKKLFNHYLIIIAITLLLPSCIENADINPHCTNVPTVNCLLSNDSVQYMKLSKSGDISQHYDYNLILKAAASLYLDGTLIGKYKFDTVSKKWILKYKPVSGGHYTLKVLLPGDTLLTAQTTMPDPANITYYVGKKSEYRRYFNVNNQNKVMWAYAVADDKSVQDEIGTNHSEIDNFNETKDDMGETYLGCTSMVHDYYLRFNKSENSNEDFFIEADYRMIYRIIFITASYEYDRYLKTSVAKMIINQDHDDPQSWLDETIVYSNIKNGLGIFGAYNEQTFDIR
jgi:hypothetical protein